MPIGVSKGCFGCLACGNLLGLSFNNLLLLSFGGIRIVWRFMSFFVNNTNIQIIPIIRIKFVLFICIFGIY